MLNVVLKYEDKSTEAALKSEILRAFPDKNVDYIFEVLKDYDEAYFAAREYFAYFFPMTTKAVIDYVNGRGVGRFWQFITDAIFDEGVNAIYRFYDGKSKKNGKILNRCLIGMDVCVSKFDKDDVLVKMLIKNRDNMVAHYGNGFGLDAVRITYDAPVLLLERLRRDKVAFDKKYFERVSFLEDDILDYFSTMIPPVITMLNANLNQDAIMNELSIYINSVINAGKDNCLL